MIQSAWSCVITKLTIPWDLMKKKLPSGVVTRSLLEILESCPVVKLTGFRTTETSFIFTETTISRDGPFVMCAQRIVSVLNRSQEPRLLICLVRSDGLHYQIKGPEGAQTKALGGFLCLPFNQDIRSYTDDLQTQKTETLSFP